MAEIWILSRKLEIFFPAFSLTDVLQELQWNHVGKLFFYDFFSVFQKSS